MKPWIRGLIIAPLLMGVGLWALPKPILLEPHTFSQVVHDRQGNLLRLELNRDEKFRLFVPLEQISRDAIEATLLQEDQYYFRHLGVNPISLVRGMWKTYGIRSRRIGGSTLTMQVARMRFHLNSGTALGKMYQIFRAIQLERHYSKRDILEAYLNLAPYGGNIEGIGAAARIYFQKEAGKISLPEALTLCVIPQNPQKRNPQTLSFSTIIAARQRLFDRWLEKYPGDAHKRPWLSLPFRVHTRAELPFEAPHFVDQVLAENTVTPLTTTLDLSLQHHLETLVKNYVERLTPRGLDNAAALLVDHRDMSVRALVGSADFFDPVIEGQVNGTTALRSPGSTLKPFIYALALNQGLIHPKSLLKDVPMSFKGYNPENMDGGYRGPVTAQAALATSRNIPAIYLNNRLGEKDLYHFLKSTNHNYLKPRDHYGLALVLGGAETSLQRLAQLYGILVNGGQFQALRFLKNAPAARPQTLLSPEAAFLTLDMLHQPEIAYYAHTPKRLPIYWKTGTSNGYRDGWTAGVFGPYILIVWVGSFDGAEHPIYCGFTGAKPLFFEIIHALSQEENLRDEIQQRRAQLNLKTVPVCATTGDLALESCPSRTTTDFIPGRSPIARSKIRRRILIDTATGLRACQYEAGKTHLETFEFWPSDVSAVYHHMGLALKSPPPFHPSCGNHSEMDHMKPDITAPKEGVIYTVRLRGPAAPIALQATTDSTVQTVFWFVGKDLIGKSTPKSPLFWNPTPGTHQLRAVDDQGYGDTRLVKVQAVE